MDMTSEITSLENQHGNGRLKLKIKFSRARGFVSDFVSESTPGASLPVHQQLCTPVSERYSRGNPPLPSQDKQISAPSFTSEEQFPSDCASPASISELQPSPQCTDISSLASRSELQLSSQHTHISSPASSSELQVSSHHTHILSPAPKSELQPSSQYTHISSPASRSELQLSSQHTHISSPASRSNLLSSSQRASVSSNPVSKLSSCSSLETVAQLSAVDSTTHWPGHGITPDIWRRTPKDPVCEWTDGKPVPCSVHSSLNVQDSPCLEVNGLLPSFCNEQTKQQGTNPKSVDADRSGVNYGNVLPDLEFLSFPEDEPDGKDTSLIHKQKERHLTSVISVSDAPQSGLTFMERGNVMEGKADMANAQLREQPSDGQPLSPFDINCNLGLADEDFSFVVSASNSSVKPDTKNIKMENPLCPWSVDGVTNSSTHFTELVPVLDIKNQVGSNSGNYEAQLSSRNQLVRIGIEFPVGELSLKGCQKDEGTDSTVRRPVVWEYWNHSGSRSDSEVNNNSQVAQFSGSISVSRDRSDHVIENVHIPHCAAFVPDDCVQDSGRNQVDLSVGKNRCTATACADSGDHHSCATETLPSDPVIDSHVCKSSLRDRCSSGFACDIDQRLPSVLCKTSCSDSVAGGRTNKQPFVSAALPLSVPFRKEHEINKVKSDFLVKLLTDTDEVPVPMQCDRSLEQTSLSAVFDESMKQLAENPPLIDPYPAYLTSQITGTKLVEDTLPSSGSVTSVSSNHLNHTISELRKRVANKGVSEDVSGVSQEHRPLHQVDSCSLTTVVKKRSAVRQRCSCDKPEISVFSPDHENIADGNVSKEQVCKKCSKRIQRKRSRKVTLTWCRCDPPSPFIPDGTITQLCRICLKRVSKKWTAAKWCKCHTPVLCSLRSENSPDGNLSGKFYCCRRCLKWISKEREDVCMKGDRFGQFAGADILPLVGLPPLITDHTYSISPFSPNAEPKDPVLAGASSTPDTAQKQLSAEYENNCIPSQTDDHGTHIPQTLLYILSHNSSPIASSSSVPSHDNPNQHFASSSRISSPDTVNIQTDNMAPVSLHFDVTTSSSLGSVSSLSGSLPSNTVSTSLSCRDSPTRNGTCINEVGNVQGESSSSSLLETNGKLDEQITCPPWLRSIWPSLLQPCYVVMEKLKSELFLDCSYVEPCSASCRQDFLNASCRQGNLQQCGHSLENKQPLNLCTRKTKRTAEWTRKRDYFKHNKTMVGYEEFREKEMGKVTGGKSAVRGGGSKVTNCVPALGSLLLSQTHPQDFTTLRITSQNGTKIQQISDSIKNSLGAFQQNEDQSCGVSGGEATDNASVEQSVTEARSWQVNGMKKKQPGVLSPHSHAGKHNQSRVENKDKNTWQKASQFNIKYYVFGAENRAFILPLMHNKRRTRKIPQLDEEDLGYVRKVINQLLAEKDSCARHLKYPDSLQHKRSSGPVGQWANKRTFVAPTLGDEDLDIEALKSLISDRDFSRLVPRNTRISKSKYLQEIGEKVHMYLTGGCEESPEWIKDVAKSIVLKHRKRVKRKTRLKPSKDVCIEIDYAQEEKLLEVGEEQLMSPSCDSVTESDFSAAGSGTALEQTENANQSNDCDQHQASEANHTFTPTGSYVVAEAFSQEEKKPLTQNMALTVHESSMSVVDGSIPAQGQQILIPLPQSCSYGQAPEENLPQSVSPSTYSFQQPHADALPDAEENPDKKPLLGELLAAPFLAPPTSANRTEDDVDHDQSEQMHSHQTAVMPTHTSGPSEEVASWSIAHIKEEPLDEDYSHAWTNHSRTEGLGQSDTARINKDGPDTIPFILNSTFGKDAVQIEDEDGSVASNRSEHPCGDSGTELNSVIKMEPFDGESSGTVSTPLITCVASGEFVTVFTNSDHSEAHSMENNSSQILSAVSGEVDPPSADVLHHGLICGTIEIAACAEKSTTDDRTHVSCTDKKKADEDCATNKDTLTFGELVSRLAESKEGELLKTSGSEVGAFDHTQVRSESVDLPQISALSFGEAAKLWQTEGDKHSAGSTEILVQSDSSCLAQGCQSEVTPFITSVLCGQTLDQTDLVQHKSENANEPSTTLREDCAEEYSEDFYEDDDFEEDDKSSLKPVILSEGQVVAVPVTFPNESNPAEGNGEQGLNVILQAGIDLSIVKQEPEEAGVPSTSFLDSSPCLMNTNGHEGSITFSSHQETSPVEQTSSVPSILDVRSLASVKSPADSGGGIGNASEALPTVQSCVVMPSSLPTESLESVNCSGSFSPDTNPNVNCDTSEMPPTETEGGSRHRTNQMSECEQKCDRSCLKSALKKTKSKKRNRKSGKRKRQQKMPTSLVVTPASMQQQNETDSPPVLEDAVSSANDVDFLLPAESASSSFSGNPVSHSMGKLDNIEHEHENESVKFASTGLMKSDEAVSSGVTGKNAAPESSRPVRMNFSGKKCTLVADSTIASSFTETAEQEKVQANNNIWMDIEPKDSHSHRTTPAVVEAVSRKKGIPLWVQDSQFTNEDKSEKNDLAPMFSDSLSTDNVTVSDKVDSAPGVVITLSAFASGIIEKLLNDKEVSSTNCPVNTSVLQTDIGTLQRPENVKNFKGSSPIKPLEDGAMDSVPPYCSDHQEDQKQAATASTVHVNPDGEMMTAIVEGEGALCGRKQSPSHTELPDDVKTSNVVDDTSTGACKANTRKSRKRSLSRSKGRKKSSKRRKSAAGLSMSVPEVSDLSSKTANFQHTVLTTDSSVLSCPSSSRAGSGERDSPALKLRILHFSNPSTNCLSENQVSSSCDLQSTSPKSDVVDSDFDRVSHSSVVPSDPPRNNAEEKFKDHSKQAVSSSHEQVQLLNDSSSQPQDSTVAKAAEPEFLDENAHYVSQIFEGAGKQGRTCLVLRKKRPAQPVHPPPASSSEPNKYGSVCEQVNDKELPLPCKRLKADVVCSPSHDVTLEVLDSKVLKQKSNEVSLDRTSDISSKASRSERSIFSDMSAVLKSISAPSCGTVSTSSKSCSSPEGLGVTKALPEAVIKVAEKNLFSRLRASLVSVKNSVAETKSEGSQDLPPCTGSNTPLHDGRERSFFDCLPQGFVDAWKDK